MRQREREAVTPPNDLGVNEEIRGGEETKRKIRENENDERQEVHAEGEMTGTERRVETER